MFLISNSSNCINVKTKTSFLFFSEKACPPYNSCYHASEEMASMPVYSELLYERVQITTNGGVQVSETLWVIYILL